MSEQDTSQQDKKNQKHKAAMEKQKAKVDARIEEASTERGVALLLTGNGKGKSSSAFGIVMRALGYGQKVGVVQFIKGQQLSGEEMYIKDHCPQVDFHQMGTGFTWNTQDRSGDIAAAEKTWAIAEPMLKDGSYDVVVLDELTYMLAYKYLDEDTVLNALKNRPVEQSVVVTGRGGGSALQDIMDTVSEVKEVKHAFKAGIKARQGVDL
ncbi:cob(I)yrinic acid a,c-diamide adenosyltransferase [Pseudomaricurvus alkylphenolicus]|jgi:cob(I)alamin adenosyltransferase|uniref:cob(I)yrinic acid a,c-diamide adenosyltransferase n=1 Tax=Pseudomaricurvus alkylphenolicus TaxID=1306991 RepID=UPI001423243C|nr:cob(I)yrinic acid a,c-diamide adenosyltransferase [Pseudomaricurvus alkylphenolicus]NIB40169.1 cob(I)yrinic acid a,c-diamide adenosyltransferase [Pseudomaricurvus alkylphenolicus]